MPQTASRPAGYQPREAAHQLSVSRSHLYTMMSSGLIRSVKIGSRRVIPATEIDRLLNVEDTDE